jgi:hypothetical protein
VVSNYYLEGEDRWTPEQERRLLELGWEHPKPPKRPNWIKVQYTTSPLVEDVASRATATLESVFGLGDDDEVFVKLFSSPIRGDSPAACLADVATGAEEGPAKPVFSRPPDDEAELDAWAESFADTLLGTARRSAGEAPPTPGKD